MATISTAFPGGRTLFSNLYSTFSMLAAQTQYGYLMCSRSRQSPCIVSLLLNMLLLAGAGSSGATAEEADATKRAGTGFNPAAPEFVPHATKRAGTGFNPAAPEFVPHWLQRAQGKELEVRDSKAIPFHTGPNPTGHHYMGSPGIPAAWVRPPVNLLSNAAFFKKACKVHDAHFDAGDAHFSASGLPILCLTSCHEPDKPPNRPNNIKSSSIFAVTCRCLQVKAWRSQFCIVSLQVS